LQRKYQRQAMRRALGRLHERDLIKVLALAWAFVDDDTIVEWQGGGSRKLHDDGYRERTPRWRRVGLRNNGLRMVALLEREASTA
jgi:hypothetical protein